MISRALVAAILAVFPNTSFAQPCANCPQPQVALEQQPSWAFRASTYTHDPATGARVAQFDRIAPVEGLDDPRAVTSSYRRTRTNIRGTDGSVDASYQVQSWGNGRGGIDAEWERFHDAWRQSLLSGSFFNQNSQFPHGNAYGYPGDFGYGNGGYGGYGNGGYGNGGGYPYTHPPQYGKPPYGPTPQNGPHFRQRYPEYDE